VVLEKDREISSTDCVKSEHALHGVKEKRNNVNTIKRRKAKFIGHILRSNCLLIHAIAGKTEGKYKGREEVEEDVSSYEWLSGKENMLEFVRGGTSLNSIGNSL
jgi:hypothetical protein